jgi:hypothetical protein
MDSHDDLPQELGDKLFFGTWVGALLLFEQVYDRIGDIHAKPGEFSHRAARAFAEGLILDPSMDSARRRMRSDRSGVVSFYEVVHRLNDRIGRDKRQEFVRETDGQNEPFLLLASAVLNYLDWFEKKYPDEVE